MISWSTNTQPSGGSRFGGESHANIHHVVQAIGGMEFGHQITVVQDLTIIPDGGTEFGGSARVDVYKSNSGSMRMGGSASVSVAIRGSGGIRFGGSRIIHAIYTDASTRKGIITQGFGI